MVQLLASFYLRETYPARILSRKAARLRAETGNEAFHTKWDEPDRTLASLFLRSLSRPWRLLLTQPIIQVLGCYNAYNFGILYLFIRTFPTLWENQYGERSGIGGLNCISLVAGNLMGSQFCSPCSDTIYKILKRRSSLPKDVDEIPEFRLPLMVIGSILTPIGLFWVSLVPFICFILETLLELIQLPQYGWSAQGHLFWLMPNIGVALYGAGLLICYQCIHVYIVDCYTSYAASAFAAATFLRSLCSFAFPLFAPYLVEVLGYGWEGTLLGCIAIVLGVPTPFILWKYGAKIRTRSRFCAGDVVHT